MSATRVTLVRPPHSNVYGVYKPLRKRTVTVGIPKDREVKPPLGLLYLAGALESIGVEVTIIDAEPEVLPNERVLEKIAALEPHFVGVTSTTPEFHVATDLITRVKKYNHNIITIVGGSHVSALPQESLRDCPGIDYVVVGEGEESIKRIVRERPDERIIVSDHVWLEQVIEHTFWGFNESYMLEKALWKAGLNKPSLLELKMTIANEGTQAYCFENPSVRSVIVLNLSDMTSPPSWIASANIYPDSTPYHIESTSPSFERALYPILTTLEKYSSL